MNIVHPIRSRDKIEEFKQYFLDRDQYREYFLFVIGINSSLRISDLLTLKWQYFDNDQFEIREHKTNKNKIITINKSMKNAIKIYDQYEERFSDYMFASKNYSTKGTPLSRQYVWRILNKAGKYLNCPIGTHTLRKTFGYHAYKSGVSLELLMKIFNHSSSDITLIYIGITDEEIAKVYLNLNL